MARTFSTASNERIVLSLGAAGFAFGPGTVAVIARPSVVNVLRDMFSVGVTNGAGFWLSVDGSAHLTCYTDNNNKASVTTLTANKCYLLACTKAGGSVNPRFHIYDYLTNTWTHETVGALGNSSVPVTEAKFGQRPATGNFYDGDIHMAGVWDVVLSDAQIESLAFDLAAWFAPAQPRGLWILDQDAVGQKVVDLSGGGANESGRSGTTVSVNSVPIWTPGQGAMAA